MRLSYQGEGISLQNIKTHPDAFEHTFKAKGSKVSITGYNPIHIPGSKPH